MKKILDSKTFLNKVLSGTQRKTPTIVHKRFPIEGIRRFYIRKIKFVQQSFSSHITETIGTFPSIDYIHPFFGNLLNLMFQRQHYKLALSKLSKSKRIIDIISRNFVKLVKNGSSLYTCKQLKKEAIGRICTIIQKLNKSLIFLEKVRKHLEKLPELDPHRKSVILSGSSKVGKSSCLNKTTRANIKVGDSSKHNNFIILGHMQTNFSRLQILDISCLSNSTDYMKDSLVIQLYSAFFNLDCIISHFFDLSGCSSITLSKQIDLFKRLDKINPKIGKLLVFTKTDLGWEKLLDQTQKSGLNVFVKKIKNYGGILKTSFHDEIGLHSMKQIMYRVTFNWTNRIGIKGKTTKIKFVKSFFKNTSQQVDKVDSRPFLRDLDKNLFNNKVLPVCQSMRTMGNNKTNFFNKNLLKFDYKNKENKPPICNKQEQEQKNREIKTEKFYSNIQIFKVKKIAKHWGRCFFVKKNETNISMTVLTEKKKRFFKI